MGQRSIKNDANKALFLMLFTGGKYSLPAAASEIGVSYQQIYAWEKEDAKFRQDLEDAKRAIADELLWKLQNGMLKKEQHSPAFFYIKSVYPQFKENARQLIRETKTQTLAEKCKER